MASSGAPVDANGCVASLWKPLDTCDFITSPQRHVGLSVEPGTSRRSNIDIKAPPFELPQRNRLVRASTPVAVARC